MRGKSTILFKRAKEWIRLLKYLTRVKTKIVHHGRNIRQRAFARAFAQFMEARFSKPRALREVIKL